jgi:hypothetical protein
MTNNLFGVYFTDVLKEMCRRVGAKYEEIDFSSDDWYLKYTWTKNEQDKFIEWFAKYLRNMGPRRELCAFPSLVRTEPQRIKFASQFISEFGWAIKK